MKENLFHREINTLAKMQTSLTSVRYLDVMHQINIY